MTEREKILIVDDEPQIRRVLRAGLSAKDYEVRTAADGISGIETFHDWSPDLIITDLQMPEADGIELTREIRRTSDVPIILLSVKGDEQTKVAALDAGADDYVTKPFGIDELMARIRVALRRRQLNTVPNAKDEILEDGDFRFDLAVHKLFVTGNEVSLTPKEFDLLLFLFRHRDRINTHRAILTGVWGGNATEQPEYLRVFVRQLRKKIEPDPSSPVYLLTEPWIGYRFQTSSL